MNALSPDPGFHPRLGQFRGGTHQGAVSLALGRMAKKNKAEKAGGRYRAPYGEGSGEAQGCVGHGHGSRHGCMVERAARASRATSVRGSRRLGISICDNSCLTLGTADPPGQLPCPFAPSLRRHCFEDHQCGSYLLASARSQGADRQRSGRLGRARLDRRRHYRHRRSGLCAPGGEGRDRGGRSPTTSRPGCATW